jgi:hypothetical protein
VSFRLDEVADVLRVSNEGLQVLAAHCDTVSAALVAAAPLPSVVLPIQATSGAVGSAYAAIGAVVTTLAGRAQKSAVKAALAGAEFVSTDAAGAQTVAAIAQV